MAELPILIVNVDNEPVGSASKQEAWRKGLIHRVVRISILDSKGQMLVQKRSMQRELFPGCWDNSAAGHVDVGETNLQAAQREMKEELGLEDLILQKQGGYYVEVTNEWRLMRRFTEAYQLTLPDNLHEEIKISPEEVDDIVWMDISEVQALVVGYPELATDGLEQVITRFF